MFTPSEVGAQVRLRFEDVIKIFSNQFGILGLLEAEITLDELYEAICVFSSSL